MFYVNFQALCPAEGTTNGGDQVVVIGENFFEGLHVSFGNVNEPAWCEVRFYKVFCGLEWSYTVQFQVITSSALRVTAPPRTTPGHVEVTLMYKSKQFCKNEPGRFVYRSPKEMESLFHRLEKSLPTQLGDHVRLSKEQVLLRASDLIEV